MLIILMIGRLKQEDHERRPAWATWRVPDQSKLYNDTLYINQQQNGINPASPSKVKPRG
jgi:hypothetical protein